LAPANAPASHFFVSTDFMMDQSAKIFPAFCPKNLHFFSDRLSEETYGKASYYLEIDGFWGNFWSKMAKSDQFFNQKSKVEAV